MSSLLLLQAGSSDGTPGGSSDAYLRPDGLSVYHRPDGTSLYLAP